MTEIQISTCRRTCGICFRPIEKGAEYVYAHYDKRKIGTVACHPKCAEKGEK
jgi:hypothetical protein